MDVATQQAVDAVAAANSNASHAEEAVIVQTTASKDSHKMFVFKNAFITHHLFRRLLTLPFIGYVVFAVPLFLQIQRTWASTAFAVK